MNLVSQVFTCNHFKQLVSYSILLKFTLLLEKFVYSYSLKLFRWTQEDLFARGPESLVERHPSFSAASV